MSEFSDFKTLKDFGYEFNPAGELKQIESGEPFKFEVKPGDKNYNQQHYEALGEVLNLEVYRLLEEKAGLKKLYLNQELDSFIFVSKDYAKKDKLLLLIHGSGVVRAGQWARRLIINNDLGLSIIQNLVNLKRNYNTRDSTLLIFSFLIPS